MTREQIASVLERYAEAKNNHDVDAILSLCAEDCFYESVPLGARIEGADAMRGFYSALFEGLPDYFGEFDGTAYSEDAAVVWGRFGGTLSGNFMGVEVEAGRRVEIPVTFVCTFRDGLLIADKGYFDAATLAEQVGVPLQTVRAGAAAEGVAAAMLLENFERLWKTKDPKIVPEMVAPDAVTHWSGLEPLRGADYSERIRQTMHDLVPDMDLEVTGHAVNGDLVFISWQARGTVGSERLEWHGIDRFRLRGELAEEIHAVYDTGPLRQAMEQAGATIDGERATSPDAAGPTPVSTA